MLTPQEVSSHAFSKAMMGGYNMAMVDEFLDELTDDYTALYKENAALKAKMKVLVEKIEDYRATEDSMRATLLTAQKMADSIVKEAEEKRDDLLEQTETEVRAKIGKLQEEVNETNQRLENGQQELAAFIETFRTACHREIEFLEQLPNQTIDEIPEKRPNIEGDIMASLRKQESESTSIEPEPPEEMPESEPIPQPEPDVTPQPEPDEKPVDTKPVGNPFGEDQMAPEEVYEPTRRVNLTELKFGRNYDKEKEL